MQFFPSATWYVYSILFAARKSFALEGCRLLEFRPMTQLRARLDGKSSMAFLIAAYASFFAWLGHSFAVRSFFNSLHLLRKFLNR